MANHRRATPLTEAEKKARNRRYAARRRHKTNNSYSRAYRRAAQRAVKYVQRYHNAIWIQYLDEELERGEKGDSTTFKHSDTKFDGSRSSRESCEHNGDVFVMGVGIGCAICGQALGEQQLTTEQRITIADLIGAVVIEPQQKAG